ncbi:hypothetical protein C6W96_11430 [Streptomyces sp. CS149]|nr:hypothetical protein C6W96_11430 [Streptomyces sp. CS149]
MYCLNRASMCAAEHGMLDEPGGILIVDSYEFDIALSGRQLGRGLPSQRRAEYLVALAATLR